MRPVIEGLIASCSTVQTDPSNGRRLWLEGCTISDWHKEHRCCCCCYCCMYSPGLDKYVAHWMVGMIRRTQTEARTLHTVGALR